MRTNRFKVLSDLSKPSLWNNLKKLDIANNPLEAVDLTIFSKYENLEDLNLSFTNVNLDAYDVTPDDISKIERLDLTKTAITNVAIFAKLKIFPNLKTLILDANSLTTTDFEVIKNGELPKMFSISLKENNFNENWIEQVTRNTAWTVDNQYGFFILKKIN